MPALVWALLIAYLLFSSSKELPRCTFFQQIPFFDKWVHGMLFCILTLLLLFGLQRQQVFKSRRYYPAIMAIVCATLYGGLTEFIQQLIPTGRTGDSYDFIADFTGIIGGFFISLLWKRWPNKSVE